MKSKTGIFIKTTIILLMLIIIIIDAIVIRHLKKKVGNLTILSWQDSSLVKLTPKSIDKPTILVTKEFIDRFNDYQSPFKDGFTFQELMEKYIRNRWSDHYGCVRGTAEKKRIHEGIDLFVPENTPVYPLADYGIITEVSDNPHYLVEVDYVKPDKSVHKMKIEYGKTIRILYPEGFNLTDRY